MSRIGIIGAGSWGLALATVAERAGHEVTIWARRPEAAREINESRMLAARLPGVSFGDWAEAEMIPARLGILHPTGYPLYLFVNKAFTLLPIGSVAYRANLLSAVAAAGEVKSAKTTRLLSGQEWLESLRKRRIVTTRKPRPPGGDHPVEDPVAVGADGRGVDRPQPDGRGQD